MKSLITLVLITILTSCEQQGSKASKIDSTTVELYNIYDSANHLIPVIDKAKLDTLHGFDFGWALLEPINLANSRKDDQELSKKFSPGQKALYFIWYLDEQVRNGGFPQFYLNDYREYIPPITDGLKLIGDTAMLSLIANAENEYLSHREEIDSYKHKHSWQPLYEAPYKFSDYNKTYHALNENMMNILENYARQHMDEFAMLK